MTFKNFYRRELHVMLHGQSRNFRIVKWAVILVIAVALYMWKGWAVVAMVLLTCAMVGICLHFFLRWKTNGWTTSWGPYTRIRLEDE